MITETLALFLKELSRNDVTDRLQAHFDEDRWTDALQEIPIIFKTNSALQCPKAKVQVRFAPPRQAMLAAAPTLPMIEALVLYCELSAQHLKGLISCFVASEHVMEVLSHANDFTLLSRLLMVWHTLADKSKTQDVERLSTLSLFARNKFGLVCGADVFRIGCSPYACTLRLYPLSVWRVWRESFKTLGLTGSEAEGDEERKGAECEQYATDEVAFAVGFQDIPRLLYDDGCADDADDYRSGVVLDFDAAVMMTNNTNVDFEAYSQFDGGSVGPHSTLFAGVGSSYHWSNTSFPVENDDVHVNSMGDAVEFAPLPPAVGGQQFVIPHAVLAGVFDGVDDPAKGGVAVSDAVLFSAVATPASFSPVSQPEFTLSSALPAPFLLPSVHAPVAAPSLFPVPSAAAPPSPVSVVFSGTAFPLPRHPSVSPVHIVAVADTLMPSHTAMTAPQLFASSPVHAVAVTSSQSLQSSPVHIVAVADTSTPSHTAVTAPQSFASSPVHAVAVTLLQSPQSSPVPTVAVPSSGSPLPSPVQAVAVTSSQSPLPLLVQAGADVPPPSAFSSSLPQHGGVAVVSSPFVQQAAAGLTPQSLCVSPVEAAARSSSPIFMFPRASTPLQSLSGAVPVLFARVSASSPIHLNKPQKKKASASLEALSIFKKRFQPVASTVSSANLPVGVELRKGHVTDIVSVNSKDVHSLASAYFDAEAVVDSSDSVVKCKKKFKTARVAVVPLPSGLHASPFYGPLPALSVAPAPLPAPPVKAACSKKRVKAKVMMPVDLRMNKFLNSL